MKMLKVAGLALMLTPAVGMAAEDASPASLVVPGIVTSAGVKFADRCNDAAFSRSADQAKLAEKCQQLLARWHAEANMRRELRNNPRLVSVVNAEDANANLPFHGVPTLHLEHFAGIRPTTR